MGLLYKNKVNKKLNNIDLIGNWYKTEQPSCDRLSEERLKKMELEGKNFDHWFELTRPYHVTIQTILDMKMGESMEVLMLNRNFTEFIEDRTDHVLMKLNQQEKKKYYDHQTRAYCVPHTIDTMIADGYSGTFIKLHPSHSIFGKLNWKINGETECFNGNSKTDTPFEFHVEYKPDYWYPFSYQPPKPGPLTRFGASQFFSTTTTMVWNYYTPKQTMACLFNYYSFGMARTHD